MGKLTYDIVIFDLDGTLLNTSKGIYGSVRYAESVMGLDPVNEDELRKFLGPPPKTMYSKIYGLTEEDALKAAIAHRTYGMEKAIFEAEIYEGIEDLLSKLRAKGIMIAVATLKKQTIAEAILRNFDIDHFFDVIVGMDEAETLTKKGTIEKVLQQTQSSWAVMVGDSEYDYLGAKEAGVDFIGVKYGFGFDLDHSYPFQTAGNPMDILPLVVGEA